MTKSLDHLLLKLVLFFLHLGESPGCLRWCALALPSSYSSPGVRSTATVLFCRQGSYTSISSRLRIWSLFRISHSWTVIQIRRITHWLALALRWVTKSFLIDGQSIFLSVYLIHFLRVLTLLSSSRILPQVMLWPPFLKSFFVWFNGACSTSHGWLFYWRRVGF